MSKVIDVLKKFPEYNSALLYVSDHGESLGENNIYLHGIPYRIAPDEQKKVPMFLWLSERAKRTAGANVQCLRRNAVSDSYSHDNIFHSLLGYLNVRTPVYDPAYDIFQKCRG